MSLLRLEAVDREDDLIDRFVLSAEDFGVLLTCGEHHLITLNVLGDGIVRELDLHSRPGVRIGSGESTCGVNTVDAQSSQKTSQPIAQLGGAIVASISGLFVLVCPGQRGSGAMVKLADQFHRTVECMNAAISMIADVHHMSTDWAIAIKNVEFPQRHKSVSLGQWYGIVPTSMP